MRRAAILLIALASAASCARPAPSIDRPLVLGVISGPTNLDPGVGLDETSQRIHQLVFSSLLTIGPDLRIVPDLATRFEPEQQTISKPVSGVKIRP